MSQDLHSSLRPVLLALVAVIAVFHFLSITPGHAWGDDWAHYVAHARNLADGRPYAETGYVYNPEARIAPPRYPPGFPLLLAPVYSLAGFDLQAMKIPGIIAFVAALALFAVLGAQWDRVSSALATTALVAFHPYFMNFKNNILSDLPFLFFLLLAIWVSQKRLRWKEPEHVTLWMGAVVGVAWWFAYSIRTVGIVLPVAFVIVALSQRSSRGKIVTPLAVFIFLAALQAMVFRGSEDYLLQFSFRPEQVVGRAREYVADLRSLFDPDLGLSFVRIEFWILTGFAVLGAARVWLAGHHLPVIFALLYGATVLLWPFHEGVRMLIPLIPFYFFASIVGLSSAAAKTGRLRFALLTAACVLTVGLYWKQYGRTWNSETEPGVESPPAQALFATVRATTPDTAVLIFRKPRALALYTGRKAAMYASPGSRDQWKFPDRSHATHFVAVLRSRQDSLYLQALMKTRAGAVTPLFANERFAIYELKSKSGLPNKF